MNTTLSINPSDPNNNVFAQNQQLGMGLNNRALNLNMNTPYEWKEPPLVDSFITRIFPSETLWHPLYRNDDYMITKNLLAVDRSELPQSEKDRIRDRIRNTVQSVPAVSSMGSFYKGLIAIAIVLIVFFFVKFSNTVLYCILGAIVLFMGWEYYSAKVLSAGRGEARWQQYQSDLNGKLASGLNMNVILDQYEKSEEKQKATELTTEFAEAAFATSMINNAFNHKK
jgi:ABC-type multidrug transport system fused ATPase/permease subunit